MKTYTLVLDSSQGLGQANSFVIRLSEPIRECLHTQLRQLIISGMSPSSDYVYVRSQKLGSNIISSRGFGAYEVVPVSKPFQYERYTAVPNRNEFECGRVLDSIDVSILNPDNTLVRTEASVVVNQPHLFDLSYTTNFNDGTHQTESVAVYIPVGTYSTSELVAAIDKALPDIELPHIQFSTKSSTNLSLVMDWTSPSTIDTILLTSPLLFNGISLTAVYDKISSLSNTPVPVSIATGTYTKAEFVSALQNALIPVGEAIAQFSSSAAFSVSLSPSDNVIINLNWTCLTNNDKIFITNGTIFNGIGVTANFTNIPPLSSPLSPIVISQGGYTRAALITAVENALSLTALGITETFKHGEFLVDVTPSDELEIHLNWVCASYGNTITLPAINFITEVVLTADFSDESTQVTSSTPALVIPAGTYTESELENAISNSLAPISAAMVSSNNYNSANFSTSIVDGIVAINLDWVCSSYSDMVSVPAMSFIVTMEITNQSVYTDTSSGFYTSPPNSYGTNRGSFATTVSIPSGQYAAGDISALIISQLEAVTNNNSGQPENPYIVTFSNGTLTIAANGTYEYTTTGVTNGESPPINTGFYQNSQNLVIRITFPSNANAEHLGLLGLNPASTYTSTGGSGGNQTPPYSFTATLGFALCPSFPPSLTSLQGVMNFGNADYTELGLPFASSTTSNSIVSYTTTPLLSSNTSFNDTTFQQRSTWTFPAEVLFPFLADVVPTLVVPPANLNGWIASAPDIVQQTPEQYSFIWRIPLSVPVFQSASAELSYDGAAALNSVIGLANGSGPQVFNASEVSFGTGVKQFTWSFPSSLQFPEVTSVAASITNGSSEVGLRSTALPGTELVFNASQRRITFPFPDPPVSTDTSKTTLVLEVTTI